MIWAPPTNDWGEYVSTNEALHQLPTGDAKLPGGSDELSLSCAGKLYHYIYIYIVYISYYRYIYIYYTCINIYIYIAYTYVYIIYIYIYIIYIYFFIIYIFYIWKFPKMGVPPTHPKLRPFSAHSSVKRFGQISSAWARRRLMLPWRSHKGMIWNQSHKGLGYICIYIDMYVYINLYIYILFCWGNLLGPISNIILPLAWYTWSWTQPLCQVAIGKTWDFQS